MPSRRQPVLSDTGLPTDRRTLILSSVALAATMAPVAGWADVAAARCAATNAALERARRAGALY